MTPSSPFPIPVSALKPVSCGSVLWRSAGVLRATIIAKISLGLVHDRSAWPTTPLDLVLEDRRRDANPISSLVEASEVVPFLPNTSVILFAQAHAPQGRPAPAVSARLALFRDHSLIDKTVHVFGERAANAPQHPRPFERVPLVYERTWGGPGSEENPVGVPANASSLPSICDSTNPTKTAGFGPISRLWPQRKRLLGATDLTRLEGQIADIPNGFDFRYYSPAPLDQQIEYLRGDEWIVLDGMHPTMPRVQSRLPKIRGRAAVFFVANNAVTHNQIIDLVPDLLVIDADKLIASVVFRGNLVLESLDVLPRLRVFADVELPGNPTRWPEGADVLRAPAPAPLNLTTTPGSSGSSTIAFSAFPGRDDNANRSALPFQPKPTTAQPTVVPFMTAPPPRPRVPIETDDPLMRTVAADPDEISGIRPPIPFLASPPVAAPPQRPAAPAPRSAPPPPMARRPADDEDATRAIDLDKLEAKRAPVTPFEEGSSRPYQFTKPDFNPVSRTLDGEESTRAIDIEQLSAKRAAVTPFAASETGKPAPAAAPIPGAPWAPPRPGSAPASVRPPAFNIEDPRTVTAVEHEIPAPAAPPFMRGATPSTPPPDVMPPPPARIEAPPMIKPPAFEPPARVEAPPRIEAPALVVPTNVTPPAPPAPVSPPFVPKDITPPVVAPPAAPPAPVVPEEPPAQAIAEAPAPAIVEVVDESSVRATVMERLRSKVPAPLHGLTVTGEDLSGLDMRGTNLSGHDLSNVKLSKTNLSGARLGGAKLVEADLEGADLSNADLANADLSRATLTNARMSGTSIENANFTSAQAAGAILDGAKGRSSSFARGHWANATFCGMDVMGADFTGAMLDGAAFDRAVLLDVKFNDARGKAARFDDARLDQGRADGSALTECSFKNVQGKGSIWENATLDGSSFEDAKMEDAVFVRTTCRETKFVNANLRAANFGKAQGDGANLSGATLDGADFRQARFAEARFEGARLSNLMAPRADFSKSNFTRADLSNGSLRAAVMSGANLAHATLDGADLRDADLRRCVLFKASRTGAKLNGANTKDAIENEPAE